MGLSEPTYHTLKKEYPDKPEACHRCKLFIHCKESQYRKPATWLWWNKNDKDGDNVREWAVIIRDTPPPVSIDLDTHYEKWLEGLNLDAIKDCNVAILHSVSCVFPSHMRNKTGEIPKKYIDNCASMLDSDLMTLLAGGIIKCIVTVDGESKIAIDELKKKNEALQDIPVVSVPYFEPDDNWQENQRNKILMRVQNTLRNELVSIPNSPLEKVLQQAEVTGRLGMDFEWSPTTGKLHTIGLATKDFAWAGELNDQTWQLTKRIVASDKYTIAGHDLARAEVQKLLEMGVREINCKWRCGLIRTWELRKEETKKARLKDIVWRDTDLEHYWGDEDVQDRAEYKELMERYTPTGRDICRGDAFASLYYDWILDEDYPEEVKALQDNGAEELDMKMILPTAYMMYKGIGIDMENVEKREKEILKILPRLKQYIQKEHGIDPGKNAQVMQKLRDYGESPYNTQEETLTELRQTTEKPAVDDLIEKLLQWRNYNTTYTRYLKGLPQLLRDDGRLSSYLKIAFAVTGRGSSSQPNMENIPKEIRDIICTTYFGKDGELWTYDRSQSEYRCVAYLSEIDEIVQAYMNNEDLHTFTAKFFEIVRKNAKNINFAGIFDATVTKLVYMLVKYGKDQEEAHRRATEFVRTLEPVKKYQRKIINEAYNRGYIETPTGRRSYRLRKQQIVNTPIQGWSADLNKRTICEFFYPMWAERLESYVWLEFHDGTELNVYKPEAPIVEKIAKEVYNVLPDIHNKGLHIPFPLDKEVHGYYWNRT